MDAWYSYIITSHRISKHFKTSASLIRIHHIYLHIPSRHHTTSHASHGLMASHHISIFSHLITFHHISSHLITSRFIKSHMSSHLITFHHKTSHLITHHISSHIFTSHATHPLVHTNNISYNCSIEYLNETLTQSEY